MMEQHQQEERAKMNYNELRKINVSDHIEKKNGLSYLSWAWAVDTLLQQDPTATWTYGEPKQFGETLECMHYPITSWNNLRKGRIHLHGHCHLPTDKRM